MKTEVVMQRELFGKSIAQKSKTEFFSATDLFRAGNAWRITNGLPPIDMSQWLQQMSGKRYDYAEVINWLLCRYWRSGCGNARQFYCFEAANGALQAAGYRGANVKAISGCDLRTALPTAPRYKIFGENP
jgi:hypothetical protein